MAKENEVHGHNNNQNNNSSSVDTCTVIPTKDNARRPLTEGAFPMGSFPLLPQDMTCNSQFTPRYLVTAR